MATVSARVIKNRGYHRRAPALACDSCGCPLELVALCVGQFIEYMRIQSSYTFQ